MIRKTLFTFGRAAAAPALVAVLCAVAATFSSAAPPKADAPPEFKSAIARNASRKFEVAARAALTEYNLKYAKASSELEKDLKVAQTDATKRGDLDEALRIRNVLAALANPPEAAESPEPAAATATTQEGGPAAPEITGDIYLTAMLEKPLKLSQYGFSRGGVSAPAYPIVVKGKAFPRGVCFHPDGVGTYGVEYTIGGHFKKFVGGVAINDAADKLGGSKTAVTFRIVGDGKVLWKSAPTKTSADFQEFSVNVAKVKTLQLFLDCPGDTLNTQAVWIDPRLR